MPDTPYPITADDPKQAVKQMKQLVDELYQERIAGTLIGDVFVAGSDDVLTLRLATTGGLEKTSSTLAVKAYATGGLQTDADGVSVLPSPAKGLATDATGIYIKLKTGYGIDADSDGLKLKKQANEPDAVAISAIAVDPMGLDHIDATAFNSALTTLRTEINAIKTVLNNVITKLETAEVLTA